ncbi:hypothetical protein NONI108955_41935 [Nocardia ninae]|uniref:Uncharacterized protein n=1 Tax=Nocardia ninae NBRC 108245 TaxID=1210091 RepID=A0A511MU25_9NOCA|nr:hypothetical protein [Nocardia ninae]GEM43728.1 hypothetical protein NN4_82470 [Nocardia ninae NBRC 108245]
MSAGLLTEYRTRSGRLVFVGQCYVDAKRREPRTLRVEAIEAPRLDFKGIERCRVHVVVLDENEDIIRDVPMEADRLVSAVFKRLDSVAGR